MYVDDLPLGIERIKWMSRHKSIGITILVLVLLRLAWRWFDRPPALPSTIPAWQERLARINHIALYVLLLAAPIAGWLAASAAGLGISWFGLFSLPPLMNKQPELLETFTGIHETLVGMLALLVLMHIGAALFHAAGRDGVLSRMLPGSKDGHAKE